MSFFYDFVKCFNIDDLSTKTTITTILGIGVMIVGNIKLKDITSDNVIILSNGEKITLSGDDLVVKSIAKGEIIVKGSIKSIQVDKV